MKTPAYHTLRIAQIVTQTADSCSLVFDVPAALRAQFVYKSGQFLTLRVPYEGGWLPRCYSLSSSPLCDEPLRVTIKQVHEGRASNWLCQQLREGAQLGSGWRLQRIENPAVLFELDGRSQRLQLPAPRLPDVSERARASPDTPARRTPPP